jgi:hypothetical protein
MSAVVAVSSSSLPPSSSSSSSSTCGWYLAESTIPGAGLGAFAGREYQRMDIVGDVQGEQVIPIVDLHFHQGSHSSRSADDEEEDEEAEDDRLFDKDTFFFLWDNYTWTANEMQGDREGYDNMEMASFGFGAVPNCAMDFVNIDESEVTWSTAQGLHRSKDPGVGGFTTVHSRKAAANQYIPMGHEIFVTYGSAWYVCV